MVALTDAINQMPFVPGRIGQLGLFREQGVSTTSVMIEEREGNLTLVETTSRGAPAVQHVANKRKARSLSVPHVALEDTILADEVQNVRAFGSENMLEGVQNVVNQRLSEMASKIDATLEHLRIGAITRIGDPGGEALGGREALSRPVGVVEPDPGPGLVAEPELTYSPPRASIAKGCIGWSPLSGNPETITSGAAVGAIAPSGEA
jgi:Phage major capsid protein E